MTREQKRQRRKIRRNLALMALCIIVAFGTGYLAECIMPAVAL